MGDVMVSSPKSQHEVLVIGTGGLTAMWGAVVSPRVAAPLRRMIHNFITTLPFFLFWVIRTAFVFLFNFIRRSSGPVRCSPWIQTNSRGQQTSYSKDRKVFSWIWTGLSVKLTADLDLYPDFWYYAFKCYLILGTTGHLVNRFPRSVWLKT